MIEIYSFAEYGEPTILNPLFFLFTVLFCLFLVFSILNIKGILLGKKQAFGKIFVFFISLILLSTFLFSSIREYKNDKQIYSECVEAYENGTFSVAKGKPSNLSYLTREIKDDYTISFCVDSVDFEWDEFKFGNDGFSKEDVALLENSNLVEVKYVNFDKNTVILSITILDN